MEWFDTLLALAGIETWVAAVVIMIGGLVALMALGLPVAFAFLVVNMIGVLLFKGAAGLPLFARDITAALTNFTLLPIPMFILMGEILFHSGVAFLAIGAIERLIARVPGRLSIVSIVGGTVFSSLSGSTIANTALLGSVLMPDMMKRGYHPTIAMGPIMATGSIAMLIPPSALAVLLGSLASSMGGSLVSLEMSISKLLIAGIVPGIVMSVVFIGYVVLRCTLNPRLAPAYDIPETTLWERWRPVLVYVLPLLIIFLVVVGSIFLGWATPTESAALGSVASLVSVFAYGRFSVGGMLKAVHETARISAMILFIIGSSITFSQILSFTQAPDQIIAGLGGLTDSPFLVLLIMLGILLVLGAFMDQVSMMLITLPFFLPLAFDMGFDMLWFGVLMLICLEISFTTPPFGLLIYVMKGVAPPHITIRQVYVAALPFIFLALCVLALIVAVPETATWLPSQIHRE